MNNNHYSVYLESIFQLANTLVIKFDRTIESINEYTELLHPGSVNPLDKKTWKYYMNVSGEYHFRDELMTITSLDTLEEIVFDKDNLVIHRATKRAYAYGSRYYKELVATYPDQETLIQGILYPVDIDLAIEAKNGQIIGYPKHLIESNEYTLLSRLQNWVDGYLFRWVVDGFHVAHDLYYLTWQSVFYSLLPETLLSLRHEKCKTNEAHSFHVWNYLASHGRLDQYKDNLTKKQALWLYRNVLHVKKNLGQIDTFEFITEHIMTARNIPLSGYNANHNLSDMPDNLYSEIEFRRETINNIASVEVLDPISLTQLLLKQDDVAKGNYSIRLHETNSIREKLENSLSNVIQTKSLESTLFDYTSSSPYNLENILLNHWIFLSSIDVYRSFITIENPRTGSISNISVKDAFVLAYYFFCKSFNLELIEIPVIPAIRVQRIPIVTIDQIMAVADKKLIPRDLAIDILSKQPIIDPVFNTEAFYNLCSEIFISADYQRGIMGLQEHYYRRGLVHGMVSQIYSDNTCRFDVDGKHYSIWFEERNIIIDDYDSIDPTEYWLSLLTRCTGVDIKNANSLANIQSAMTNIMTQLSSYTVQFLNEINSSPLKMIEPLTVRPGDVEFKTLSLIEVDHNVVDVIGYTAKHKHPLVYDIGHCGLRERVEAKQFGRLVFDIVVKNQDPLFVNRLTYHVHVGNVGPSIINHVDDNDEGVFPLPGIDIYLSQSDADRKQVIDMYDKCYLEQNKL